MKSKLIELNFLWYIFSRIIFKQIKIKISTNEKIKSIKKESFG